MTPTPRTFKKNINFVDAYCPKERVAISISLSNAFFADIQHAIHTQTFFRQRWNCKSNQLSEDEGEVKQPAAMEPSKPGQVGKAFIVGLYCLHTLSRIHKNRYLGKELVSGFP